MFNDIAKLYKEVNNLKKEIEALKDEQIKQRRDNNDAMYNLDSDNLPELKGLVKEINLRLKDSDVTAEFVIGKINGESAAKISADRINLEGKTVQLLSKGEATGKFVIDQINGESVAKINADRIELEGSNFVGMFLKDTDVDASFVMERVNDESAAKIKADRLDIEGKQLNIKVDAANITGTFTVKEADGDVLLSAGDGVVKIGSWNVDNNSLWTGTSFSAEDSIFLSTGSNGDLSIAGSPAQENWVMKAGKNFGVDKEGKAYLSEAHISGRLTAGSGSKIGYWNIDAELGFYTDTAQEEEIYYVRDLDLSEHKIVVQQIKFALNHKGIQTIYTATYKGIASSDIDDTLFVTPTAFEKATGFTFKGVVNASYAGLSLTQKYEISWISLGACIVERIKSED